jgi:uridine kinase
VHCSPDEAVALVQTRLEPLSGTRWVGVDGLGAAGKTTLAARLAAALPGAVVVAVDDFARPLVRGWDRDRFTAQLLEPLLAGRTARYQRWDFDADTGAEWAEVRPGHPVVVEGVSATDVRVPVPWDLTLWVDVPREERRRRAYARDGAERWPRWVTDWFPSEEAYEAEQRPQDRVDLVVDAFAQPSP